MSYWGYYYKPSRPRQVKGGIKSQSKIGGFGKSWWARRWIDVLESFHIDSRLSRGKSYARRGQVVSIDIGEGRVAARVQGSRSTPYKVSIGMKPIPAAGWKRAIAAMASEAVFSARLLNGEMPQEIEKAFTSAKLSLFPKSLRELDTECSCPDWSNPCKHIAAVYYLLGEEFDRDPFLIFRLRGMEREDLLKALGKAARSEGGPKPARGGGRRKAAHEISGQAHAARETPHSLDRAPSPQAPPLPTDPAAFWGNGGDFAFPEAGDAPQSPPLFGRLGGFPFWRGSQSFRDAIEEMYRQASPAGMDLFLGQRQTT
jgi:uncharacterized Zn finger protein